VSNTNRTNDAKPHTGGVVVAAGDGEDAIIERLLNADAAYKDNLPYAFMPANGERAYNSNGYVAGILRAAGLPSPNIPVAVPGFSNPVPVEAFQ
jgi:hypothetical protein